MEKQNQEISSHNSSQTTMDPNDLKPAKFDTKKPSNFDFVANHNQEFDVRLHPTTQEPTSNPHQIMEDMLNFTIGVNHTIEQSLLNQDIALSDVVSLNNLGTEEEIQAQLAGLIAKSKHKDWEMGDSSIDKDDPTNDSFASYQNITQDQLTKAVINQGLRYNEGKLDFTLMDLKAFEPMIRVLEYGAHKYSTFKHPISNEVYKGIECSPEDVKRNKMITITSGRDNWKMGGPNMSLLKLTSSLFRHLAAFLGGEDNDSESHLPHTGHMMCNLMFLSYHLINHQKNKKQKKGSQFDDRFKS